MKFKKTCGVWLCVLAMLVPASAFAAATKPSESATANRLLQRINSDAFGVRQIAAQWEQRIKNPNGVRWLDYDRLWNEMEPSVEDMEISMVHLASIKDSLSADQQKLVDSNQALIHQVRRQSRSLLWLLDKPGVRTNDARFQLSAQSLLNDASRLARASRVS